MRGPVGRLPWPFEINRDSPQAQGLELAVMFVPPGGIVLPQGGLANPTIFRGRFEPVAGPGIDFNTTDNNYAEIEYPDYPFLTDAGLTVIWTGIVDASGNFRHFTGKHASAGATNNPIDFRTNNATTAIHVVRSHATASRTFSNSTNAFYTVGLLQTFAVRFANNLLQTAPDLFIDGEGPYTGSTISGSGTGAVTGSGAAIRIGRRPDGVQMDGFCQEVRYYNRAISDRAILAASRESTRWDLYQPMHRSFFVGAGGGGGSTERSRTFIVM